MLPVEEDRKLLVWMLPAGDEREWIAAVVVDERSWVVGMEEEARRSGCVDRMTLVWMWGTEREEE